MKIFYNVLIAIFILCITLFITYNLGRSSAKRAEPDVRIDTLIIRDTIRDTLLVPVNRYVVRVDSIPYYIKGDTVVKYVNIPIERKEYRTDSYFAVVEGYRPSLSYIETYDKTVYIDRVERIKVKSRWGLGVQVGYGYTFDKFYPYVGVGLQYNIISW